MVELSDRLQKWLLHVRSASETGVSLRAYALEHGLSASVLYQAKSDLMKLGAWPRSVVRKAKRTSVPDGFVQMKVASASCRLSHVSGWSIECDLPPAQWLNELVRGVPLQGF